MDTSNDRGLTPDDRKLLRAPIHGSAVRWLPIGKLTKSGSQQFMPHLNASIVIERLSEVDPNWTYRTRNMVDNTVTDAGDPFGLKHGAPVECLLTVKGVTRPGIGQMQAGGKADDKHLKSVHSDALKRAALAFEVGAYLRAFETVFLPGGNGANFSTREGQDSQGRKVLKMAYLTDAGKRQLRAHYDRIVASADFVKRYGDAIAFGDEVLDDDSGLANEVETIAAETEAAEVDTTTNGEADVLVLMAGYTGRDTPADVVRETLKQHSFTRCMAKIMASLKPALMLSEDDAEKLRVQATAATEGGDAALGELEDALDQLKALAESGQGEEQAAMPV